MSADYWLGVATLPAIALSVMGATRLIVATLRRFADRGMTANLRWKRGVEKIDDYTLRNNIWWERSWGPIFAGGWYRDHSGTPRATRWIGLGSVHGPCLCGYLMRDLV